MSNLIKEVHKKFCYKITCLINHCTFSFFENHINLKKFSCIPFQHIEQPNIHNSKLLSHELTNKKWPIYSSTFHVRLRYHNKPPLVLNKNPAKSGIDRWTYGSFSMLDNTHPVPVLLLLFEHY